MTNSRLLAAGVFLMLVAVLFLFPQSPTRSETLSLPSTPRSKSSSFVLKIPTSRVAVSKEREEFQSFLRDGYQALGRDEELLTASHAEKEHYSPGLLRSSEWLGAIADRLEKSPDFALDALHFYAKCSEDEALLVPVRAVCYRNVFDVANRNAVNLKNLAFDADTVARDVKELAAKIP